MSSEMFWMSRRRKDDREFLKDRSDQWNDFPLPSPLIQGSGWRRGRSTYKHLLTFLPFTTESQICSTHTNIMTGKLKSHVLSFRYDIKVLLELRCSVYRYSRWHPITVFDHRNTSLPHKPTLKHTYIWLIFSKEDCALWTNTQLFAWTVSERYLS